MGRQRSDQGPTKSTMLVMTKALIPFLVLGDRLRRNVRNIWRAGPSTQSKEEKPAPSTKTKEAKSVDDIQQEVRELLENNLVGKADAVKLKTLITLVTHLISASKNPNLESEEYRRAIVEWGGYHMVLIVLRQELDKGERGASRLVVLSTIRFLQMWNIFVDLQDTMLRLDGVGTVARAMKTFPNEPLINSLAVRCLYNLTCDGDEPRRQRLVDEDCIPLILRALPALKKHPDTQKYALVTLDRLCRVAGPQRVEGLVDASAVGALVEIFNANKDSRADVVVACSNLMNRWLK
jgi:hypothetical protein